MCPESMRIGTPHDNLRRPRNQLPSGVTLEAEAARQLVHVILQLNATLRAEALGWV